MILFFLSSDGEGGTKVILPNWIMILPITRHLDQAEGKVADRAILLAAEPTSDTGHIQNATARKLSKIYTLSQLFVTNPAIRFEIGISDKIFGDMSNECPGMAFKIVTEDSETGIIDVLVYYLGRNHDGFEFSQRESEFYFARALFLPEPISSPLKDNISWDDAPPFIGVDWVFAPSVILVPAMLARAFVVNDFDEAVEVLAFEFAWGWETGLGLRPIQSRLFGSISERGPFFPAFWAFVVVGCMGKSVAAFVIKFDFAPAAEPSFMLVGTSCTVKCEHHVERGDIVAYCVDSVLDCSFIQVSFSVSVVERGKLT